MTTSVGLGAGLAGRNDLPLLRAGDLADEILADAAQAVVADGGRAPRHLQPAEPAGRGPPLLHGVRFATPDDRVAVAERITDLAVERSLTLTPPVIHHTPDRYLRADGSSRLRPAGPHRLHDPGPPRRRSPAPRRRPERWTRRPSRSATVAPSPKPDLPGKDVRLSTDQALAVEKIATSGRALTCLSGRPGPASRPPWPASERRGRPSTARVR